MRYLVFPTETAAAEAVAAIDSRARAVFAAQGYKVREDGAVLGKCGGVDSPDGPTLTWDVPRQRTDGAWVVAHPEAHPSASFEVAPGLRLVDHLMTGIFAPIEEADATWWPAPPAA